MHHQPPTIFCSKRSRLRRNRSAKNFPDHDFLHRRAFSDIVDRLETVNRNFPKALFVGAGALIAELTSKCGVDRIVTMDKSRFRLTGGSQRVIGDEERLPIKEKSFDLIVSLLTLHSTNDLVGALAQTKLALKPDGLFVGAVFSEATLTNFRQALYAAEIADRSGIVARFSPMASIQDLGGALTRAGFALPSVDIDRVSVKYKQPHRLIEDLRGMGETNVLAGPVPGLSRKTIGDAMRRFEHMGSTEKFEIAFLTGWAPHPGQQKPLKPGSAQQSLRGAVLRKTT